MGKWSFYTTNEIKPDGWLYSQLKLQAEGLCGNLDKVWPDVRDSAWIGGEREGWERVPYWLDGFIPLAYLLDDKDMIARAKRYIDAILDRQQSDGWICPCTVEQRASYDTWAISLITKVLTVYYNCSNDERIPSVIYKILKNYYKLLKSNEIKLFDWGRFRWFELFISLNFIYERYREPWIADLARIMKEQGTDYEGLVELWKCPRNEWTLETHIVNIAMMLKYEAVSCELLGNDYKDVAEQLRGILKEYNSTAVEAFTGDECLSGISAIQGTELCAVVEQMYSYEHLFAYTGEYKWAERLETLAFNALPAALSDDTWTHQYVQMGNQIACKKFPEKSLFRTNNSEAHLFGLEPNYGCCTANFGQGWPKLALSAFMHSGDRIISVLPIPSRLKTESASISLETKYPFENTLTYTVKANKDLSLEVRIPKGAKNIQVNGDESCSDLIFDIIGGETRKIEIGFTLEAQFEQYADGLSYIKYGSLVFSLPIEAEYIMHEYEKNGVERRFPYCDYELLPKSDWGFGFTDTSLEVKTNDIGAVPFSQNEPPITIKASFKRINWEFEDGFDSVCAKTPKSLNPVSDKETRLLIPYGCAKLRMTMLPFVE
ncbi:MAG: hypothetical protein E7595_04435 [Ruminococcaceae bacterium]|nr:hypothetical protein [Oscillospiraceae bacterium]